MFLDFFYTLRAFKIPVTITEWMTFTKALYEGFANNSLTDFYYLARSILVKSETFYDQFDIAFKTYFENLGYDKVEIEKVLKWLAKAIQNKELSREELKKIKRYNFEELRKLFYERLKEQKERHDGGSKWIGTGGTSPFGHSGYHPEGIRVGGESKNRSAIQIASERRFKNYRTDVTLDVRQIKVALKKLRILQRIGAEEELDLDETIDKTCKNGGEIELVFKKAKKNNVKLLLLMDTGGSMLPHARLVDRLFSAANSIQHFRDFKFFYFHNCIYDYLYLDYEKGKVYPTPLLFKNFEIDYRVIIVGDAMMAPSELFMKGGNIDYWFYNETPGIEWLKRIASHFKKVVWLNPVKKYYWDHPTINAIKRVFPMFPLTIEGLEDAVKELVKVV